MPQYHVVPVGHTYQSAVDACIATDGPYATRDEALARRTDGYTIGTSYTEREIRTWVGRERERMSTGQYLAVPWAHEPWAYELERYTGLGRPHVAHVSRSKPGCIAYTPSDDFGHEDRQLRVTAGVYLARFATVLSEAQRAEYVAMVKTMAAADDTVLARILRSRLHFATATDDIVRLYESCRGTGVDSCMTKPADQYSGRVRGTHTHPVSVYGDSDLALAYQTSADGGVRARAIVWPERRTYGRIYGDLTLKYRLESEGYTHAYAVGARIRRIPSDCGRYILPYLDGGLSVSDDCSPAWLTIVEDDESIAADNTNGISGPVSGYETCDHCGDSYDPDSEGQSGYRQTCCDNNWSCDTCGRESFDPDERYGTDSVYCESCYDDMRVTCIVCDDTYVEEEYGYTRRRTRRHSGHADAHICHDCSDEYEPCEHDPDGYHAVGGSCAACIDATEIMCVDTDLGDVEPLDHVTLHEVAEVTYV